MSTVRFQHIRSATGVLEYGDRKFLIDPVLAKKGAYPGFPNSLNSHLRNPLVELPVTVEALLDVDIIISTHLHTDHWDDAADELVPKDKCILTQNDEDAAQLRSRGFTNVKAINAEMSLGDITITATPCQHGSDALYAVPQMAEALGKVSGYFFHDKKGSKTILFAADTIYFPALEKKMVELQPDVIVINAGDAQLDGFGSILMGRDDIGKVHAVLPNALIVPVHLEAINHCPVTRKEVREFARDQGIEDKVRVLEDGEVLVL